MADNKKNLHVKTGDRVIVTAGKDKGKIGNIKKSIPSEKQVIVEGVNMVTKATKANPAYGIQGGLIKKEAPLDSSNVMIVCPSCEKPTRIKHAVVDGKKVRVCKKCGENYNIVSVKPKVEGICDKCGKPLMIRKDDEPATVLDRLATYHKQTEPLKDYYRAKGVLVEVCGENSVEETTELVLKAIGK